MDEADAVCVACTSGYYKSANGTQLCDRRCPTRSGTLPAAIQLNDCKCLSGAYIKTWDRNNSDVWSCFACDDLVGASGAVCLDLESQFLEYNEANPWDIDRS
eukprot:3347022-Amphidinium_carterae.1